MNRYHKLAAALLIAVAYLVAAVLVLREQATAPNFNLCPLCGK